MFTFLSRAEHYYLSGVFQMVLQWSSKLPIYTHFHFYGLLHFGFHIHECLRKGVARHKQQMHATRLPHTRYPRFHLLYKIVYGKHPSFASSPKPGNESGMLIPRHLNKDKFNSCNPQQAYAGHFLLNLSRVNLIMSCTSEEKFHSELSATQDIKTKPNPFRVRSVYKTTRVPFPAWN